MSDIEQPVKCATILKEASKAEVEREIKQTISFSGAVPITVDVPSENRRYFFASPSESDARGIPNVSVLLFANGQCAPVTEQRVTAAMEAEFDKIAKEEVHFVSSGSASLDADSILLFKARIVRRLRREWQVGRIVRKVDGEWDFIHA